MSILRDVKPPTLRTDLGVNNHHGDVLVTMDPETCDLTHRGVLGTEQAPNMLLIARLCGGCVGREVCVDGVPRQMQASPDARRQQGMLFK